MFSKVDTWVDEKLVQSVNSVRQCTCTCLYFYLRHAMRKYADSKVPHEPAVNFHVHRYILHYGRPSPWSDCAEAETDLGVCSICLN